MKENTKPEDIDDINIEQEKEKGNVK